MQSFKDSATGELWEFDDDVEVTEKNGVYSFKTAWGKHLNVPTTLQPYTPPAPTAAKKLQSAKDTKSQAIKAACATAIASAFTFTAGGQTYTATLSDQDQRNLTRNSAVALGVPAKAVAWSADMVVQPRGLCSDGGQFYISMAGGTCGATKPVWPTSFSTPVADGTASWQLFGLLVGTTQGTIRVTYDEFVALYEQFSEFMDTTIGKCLALLNEVTAATTVTAVQAVAW